MWYLFRVGAEYPLISDHSLKILQQIYTNKSATDQRDARFITEGCSQKGGSPQSYGGGGSSLLLYVFKGGRETTADNYKSWKWWKEKKKKKKNEMKKMKMKKEFTIIDTAEWL